MFHRINIREEVNSQRFLGREGDTLRQPDVYIMKVLFVLHALQFVKNLTASKFQVDYPRSVDAIVNRHYVDDYVDSFTTVEEAIGVSQKVTEIHSKAGFVIRGFVSNSTKLLQAINGNFEPECDSKNICGSKSICDKVIGLHWDAKQDIFFFNLTFAKIPTSV